MRWKTSAFTRAIHPVLRVTIDADAINEGISIAQFSNSLRGGKKIPVSISQTFRWGVFFFLYLFFFSLFFLRTPGECLNNRKRWTEGKNPSGTPRFVESRRLLPSLLAWNATASGSPSPPGNPSFFFFFFSFFSCFYYTKIIIRQLVSSQPIGPFKKYI